VIIIKQMQTRAQKRKAAEAAAATKTNEILVKTNLDLEKPVKKRKITVIQAEAYYVCTKLGTEKIQEWQTAHPQKSNPWWDAVIHLMTMSSRENEPFTLSQLLKMTKREAAGFYKRSDTHEQPKEGDCDGEYDPELEYWVEQDEIAAAASDMKAALRSKSLLAFVSKWVDKGYWLHVSPAQKS
jgi:hypothetical protein